MPVRIDNGIPIKTTNMHHYFVAIMISPPKLAMRKKNILVSSAIASSIILTFLNDHRINCVGKM